MSHDQDNASFITWLARESIRHYLAHGKYLPCPEPVPEAFRRKAGAFVTLKKRGELRGCIGSVHATVTVAHEVIHNAVSSAVRDPRFPPVTLDEIPELSISVDVLEEPEPVSDLADLDPSVYGVIVRSDGKSGLLLPDLEGIEDVPQQIEVACRKAGIGKREPFVVQRFRVSRYGKK